MIYGKHRSRGNVYSIMLSDKDIHSDFIGSDKSWLLLLIYSKYMGHLPLQKSLEMLKYIQD